MPIRLGIGGPFVHPRRYSDSLVARDDRLRLLSSWRAHHLAFTHTHTHTSIRSTHARMLGELKQPRWPPHTRSFELELQGTNKPSASPSALGDDLLSKSELEGIRLSAVGPTETAKLLSRPSKSVQYHLG